MSPDQACLVESSLAAQQTLADSRYLRSLLGVDQKPTEQNAEDDNADEIDDLTEDHEDSHSQTSHSTTLRAMKTGLPEWRMAPWSLTGNFLAFLAGKLYLDLNGPADPSHCGAAFSFLRLPQRMVAAQKALVSNMQSGNVAASTKPSHPQDPQSTYLATIQRIWEAQQRWLGGKQRPSQEASVSALPTRSIPYDPTSSSTSAAIQPATENTKKTRDTQGNVVHLTIRNGHIINEPAGEDDDEAEDLASFEKFLREPIKPKHPPELERQSSASSSYLIVERVIDGIVQEQTIRDPLVIAAYVKERALQDRLATQQQSLNSRLQKSTRVKKASSRKMPSKFLSTATCSHCGAVGHKKSSRTCPLYGQDKVQVKRAKDVSLEEAGMTVSAAGRISISRASLERVDAEAKARMRLTLPASLLQLKRPPAQIDHDTPKKDASVQAQRRAARNAAAAQLAREMLSTVIEPVLAMQPQAEPFSKPVSKRLYPIYYRLIAEPRDLGTLKKRLVIQAAMGPDSKPQHRPRYLTAESVLAEIALMAENCRTFNGPEHIFTQWSQEILQAAREKTQVMKEEVLTPLELQIQNATAEQVPPPPLDSSQSQQQQFVVIDEEPEENHEEQDENDGEDKGTPLMTKGVKEVHFVTPQTATEDGSTGFLSPHTQASQTTTTPSAPSVVNKPLKLVFKPLMPLPRPSSSKNE